MVMQDNASIHKGNMT